jgi:nickel-dependent lactate racemase
MPSYRLPYGKGSLDLNLPDRPGWEVSLLAPREALPAADPLAAVEAALDAHPLPHMAGTSAVVAINDKTRPVPHSVLLPPLLRRLEALGYAAERITLLIATGTHTPMRPDEFVSIVPQSIVDRYPIYSHDCDDAASLVPLGRTARGTPVAVNQRWLGADLRVVVGNIEPHQFMGFSGGVKSAAVGLTGRPTITANHAMMTAPGAEINSYEANPCRQDVEEIGRMIGVHYALNAVLNDHKQIVHAFAGAPLDVMARGIPLLRSIYQVEVDAPFDLVIVSPGGHPKDINLYQGQKALAHATMVTRLEPRRSGAVILVAACPEGSGSGGYERWMLDGQFESHEDVLEAYAAQGYRIGPHKAWQIARDATRVRLTFVSEMPPELARRLLLNPCPSLDEAVLAALRELPDRARIAVMPFANATIPVLR